MVDPGVTKLGFILYVGPGGGGGGGGGLVTGSLPFLQKTNKVTVMNKKPILFILIANFITTNISFPILVVYPELQKLSRRIR